MLYAVFYEAREGRMAVVEANNPLEARLQFESGHIVKDELCRVYSACVEEIHPLRAPPENALLRELRKTG